MSRMIRLDLDTKSSPRAGPPSLPSSPIRLNEAEIAHIWEKLFGLSRGRHAAESLKKRLSEMMGPNFVSGDVAGALRKALESNKLTLEEYDEVLKALATAKEWQLRRKRLL